jgi:hypothetical protein
MDAQWSLRRVHDTSVENLQGLLPAGDGSLVPLQRPAHHYEVIATAISGSVRRSTRSITLGPRAPAQHSFPLTGRQLLPGYRNTRAAIDGDAGGDAAPAKVKHRKHKSHKRDKEKVS